jgi:teichuronic acid biosynthesis glycosyltransferase TuaG
LDKKHVAILMVMDSNAVEEKQWIENVMNTNTNFYSTNYEIILINYNKDGYEDTNMLMDNYANLKNFWIKNVDCRDEVTYMDAVIKGLLFAKQFHHIDQIVFLDKNIVPNKGWLFQVLQCIESDPNIAIGGIKILNNKNEIIDTGVINNGQETLIPYKYETSSPKRIIEDRLCVASDCMIFRPSMLEQFPEGPTDNKLLNFSIKKINDGKRICYFPMTETIRSHNKLSYYSNKLISNLDVFPIVNHVPKVGIIMPSYNSEKYIEKSLNGILNQTYKNWCIFIADDNSSDDTYKIISSYISNFKDKFQLRRFVSKNVGPSIARNACIEKLKEYDNIEFIAYCDSDDIWLPNHLEDSINEFIKYSETDFVYSDPICKFEDGSLAVPYGIPYYVDIDKEKLINGNSIYISSVVHRRKCLDVGEFDDRLDSIEDWDYWCRIAESGYKMFHICKTQINYIVKQSSNGMASQNNSEKMEIFHQKRIGV